GLGAARHKPWRVLEASRVLAVIKEELRRHSLNLRFMQSDILRARAKELVMRTDPGDAATFQYHDAIGDFKWMENVGNDECGSIAYELTQGFVHERFDLYVRLAGKLIQDEDPWIA